MYGVVASSFLSAKYFERIVVVLDSFGTSFRREHSKLATVRTAEYQSDNTP
jgi:hypothetical protein